MNRIPPPSENDFKLRLLVVCWLGVFFSTVFPTVFFSGETLHFPAPFFIMPRIGDDLRWTLEWSRSFIDDDPALRLCGFPPLAQLLFLPLVFPPFDWVYRAWTVGITAGFLAPFAMLARKERGEGSKALALLLMLVCVFSYGLWFELERGQFNLAAFYLVWASLLLYRKTHHCLFPMLLLSLAVHLKLYPLIFVVFLVDTRLSIPRNLLRFVLFGVWNVALLFVTGPERLSFFLGRMTGMTLHASPVNHAIPSFLSETLRFLGLGQQYAPPPSSLVWLFRAVVLALLLANTLAHLFSKRQGFNHGFLLACTLGACLLTGVSHDYKLALIPVPFAFYFLRFPVSSPRLARLHVPAFAITTFCFCWLLFPASYKPLYLQNSFPFLLLMLAAVTFAEATAVSWREVGGNMLAWCFPWRAQSPASTTMTE